MMERVTQSGGYVPKHLKNVKTNEMNITEPSPRSSVNIITNGPPNNCASVKTLHKNESSQYLESALKTPDM